MENARQPSGLSSKYLFKNNFAHLQSNHGDAQRGLIT
jgi:hypothetical protein